MTVIYMILGQMAGLVFGVLLILFINKSVDALFRFFDGMKNLPPEDRKRKIKKEGTP